MISNIENGPPTTERSNTVGLTAVTALSRDLTALVDVLEAEMNEHRVAGVEIVNRLHELRLRSERLFSIA